MGKGGAPRPRLTDEMKLEIAALHRKGLGVGAIQAQLLKSFKRKVDRSTIEVYGRRVPQDAPLIPWGSGWPTDAAEIAYLLRLRAFIAERKFDFAGNSVLPHTAFEWPLPANVVAWALSLRVALGPPDTNEDCARHLTLAEAYVLRKEVAHILGEPIDTADLDAWIAFRPWESEARDEMFRRAVAAGVAPGRDELKHLRYMEILMPGFISELYRGIKGGPPLMLTATDSNAPGAGAKSSLGKTRPMPSPGAAKTC